MTFATNNDLKVHLQLLMLKNMTYYCFYTMFVESECLGHMENEYG